MFDVARESDYFLSLFSPLAAPGALDDGALEDGALDEGALDELLLGELGEAEVAPEAPDFGDADGLALVPVSAAPVLASMPSLAMVSESSRPVGFRPSLV